MATAEQYIAECRKHLGEDSLYTGENPDWAWCAKFLSSVAKDLGMSQFDSWAASGIYAACEPIADEEVKPGDFVCFNFDGSERTDWFDHIGVVTWFDHTTQRYGTIEGNSGWDFTVGEYEYFNPAYPPKTYFCRPDYEGGVMAIGQEVWEYEWNQTAPGGNMYNCAVDTNITVHNIANHLDNMAVGKIDYLVEQIIDKLCERLKDRYEEG